MRHILVMVLLILSAGCALKTDRSSQPVPIRKNSPVVYIHPLDNIYHEASVGVLPFAVPDNFGKDQGRRIAELFKDILLGKRSFPKVRLIEGGGDNPEAAMERGRHAGVDLVMVGRIHHALEGSEFGGARLEAAIKLLNVRTGNTVWYIEHSLDQPMDFPKVSTLRNFFASFNPPPVRPSHGAPAMPNMLAKAAVDTANIIAGARTVQR